MIARCVVCEHVERFDSAMPARCGSCGAGQSLRLVREAPATGNAPRWRRSSLPVMATALEEALADARS